MHCQDLKELEADNYLLGRLVYLNRLPVLCLSSLVYIVIVLTDIASAPNLLNYTILGTVCVDPATIVSDERHEFVSLLICMQL